MDKKTAFDVGSKLGLVHAFAKAAANPAPTKPVPAAGGGNPNAFQLPEEFQTEPTMPTFEEAAATYQPEEKGFFSGFQPTGDTNRPDAIKSYHQQLKDKKMEQWRSRRQGWISDQLAKRPMTSGSEAERARAALAQQQKQLTAPPAATPAATPTPTAAQKPTGETAADAVQAPSEVATPEGYEAPLVLDRFKGKKAPIDAGKPETTNKLTGEAWYDSELQRISKLDLPREEWDKIIQGLLSKGRRDLVKKLEGYWHQAQMPTEASALFKRLGVSGGSRGSSRGGPSSRGRYYNMGRMAGGDPYVPDDLWDMSLDNRKQIQNDIYRKAGFPGREGVSPYQHSLAFNEALKDINMWNAGQQRQQRLAEAFQRSLGGGHGSRLFYRG